MWVEVCGLWFLMNDECTEWVEGLQGTCGKYLLAHKNS